MSDIGRDPDDDETLAAEYALGVLDAGARRSVERRMRRDPALASAVEDWQLQLSPMLEHIALVAPPSGLWDGISGDLDRVTRLAARQDSSLVKPVGRRVSGLWQWFGLASFGLAVSSLAALIVVARPVAVLMPMTAEIVGDGGPVMYTAVVDRSSSSAVLVPVAVGAAEPGHSHELWIIAPGAAPKSLGVIAASGPIRIEIARALLENGRVLAITLEPAGGSTTGKPTGPVVAKGELSAI